MKNPYDVQKSYQTNSIMTASPEKLVLMMYEGAVRFLYDARQGIRDKNIEEAHKSIVKVQNIISELNSSLNMEGGQIAKNLSSLYNYFHERLVEANLRKDEKIIDEILNLIIPLRDAWSNIVNKKQQSMEESITKETSTPVQLNV